MCGKWKVERHDGKARGNTCRARDEWGSLCVFGEIFHSQCVRMTSCKQSDRILDPTNQVDVSTSHPERRQSSAIALDMTEVPSGLLSVDRLAEKRGPHTKINIFHDNFNPNFSNISGKTTLQHTHTHIVDASYVL